MTDDLTAADPHRDWKPITALPDEPLTDEQLRPLLDTETIEEIWVPEPEGRPAVNVPFYHGDGNVIQLFIELADRTIRAGFVKPAGSELGWHRSPEQIDTPPAGDGDAFEAESVVPGDIPETYVRLSEVLGGGA